MPPGGANQFETSRTQALEAAEFVRGNAPLAPKTQEQLAKLTTDFSDTSLYLTDNAFKELYNQLNLANPDAKNIISNIFPDAGGQLDWNPDNGLNNNFFDTSGPLRPRDAFLAAIKKWEFNVPMQNLWAVVFEFPEVMQHTIEGEGFFQPGNDGWARNAGPDQFLDHLGEFPNKPPSKMNANVASHVLKNPAFHKTAGCLFAQSLNIPGEQVQATWQHPDGGTGLAGGLVGFPIFGLRQEFRRLNIGFRETNFSFIDFILRPWLIIASHLGLTERHPGLRMSVKTNIKIIQFAKMGSALHAGQFGEKTRQVIGLVPRKIWNFKDCVPTNLPQGDYSYGESQIETRTIEFIYSKYEVTAPLTYIDTAMQVTDNFIDDIHRISGRPKEDTVRKRAAHAHGSYDAGVKRLSNHEIARSTGDNWNNRRGLKPEIKKHEIKQASDEKTYQLGRPKGSLGALIMPEDKSEHKTHGMDAKHEGKSRPLIPESKGGGDRWPEDKSPEKTHGMDAKHEGKSRPLIPESKGGGNRWPEDKSKEKTHSMRNEKQGKARPTIPDSKGGGWRLPDAKGIEEEHRAAEKSKGDSRPTIPESKGGGWRLPDAMGIEEEHQAEALSSGHQRPMPAAGGYAWNVGNRGGLFGWLK